MKRITVGVAMLTLLVVVTSATGGTTATPVSGSWVGRYTLSGPGELLLQLRGRRAFVALGVGHADVQSVPLSTVGGRVRFQLAGRPEPVAFDGAITHGRLAGTVRREPLAGRSPRVPARPQASSPVGSTRREAASRLSSTIRTALHASSNSSPGACARSIPRALFS